MTKWIIIGIILLLIVAAIRVADVLARKSKRVFHYSRRDALMTRAERECYTALVAEMGNDYHFFPQIHLDSLVIPTDSGPSRLYAFQHINQKSVDFVACDKVNLNPLFAIELDDKSHNLPRRIARDKEVERILDEAKIPLVRVRNQGQFNARELAQEVRSGIRR
jgi:hypothetical protein